MSREPATDNWFFLVFFLDEQEAKGRHEFRIFVLLAGPAVGSLGLDRNPQLTILLITNVTRNPTSASLEPANPVENY